MKAPDHTYRFLYPKDVSGSTLETFYRKQSQTILGDTSFTINGVSKDRILVLSNIIVELIPGLGQSATRLLVLLSPPGGITFNIIVDDYPIVADLDRAFNWAGEVFCIGGGVETPILQFNCSFDAAGVNNIGTATVCGYVIPRGNVAPF